MRVVRFAELECLERQGLMSRGDTEAYIATCFPPEGLESSIRRSIKRKRVADAEEEIGLALETPAAEPESASSRNHRLITSLIGGARG